MKAGQNLFWVVMRRASLTWLAIVAGSVVVVLVEGMDTMNPLPVSMTRIVGTFAASLALWVAWASPRGEGRRLAMIYTGFLVVQPLFLIGAVLDSVGIIDQRSSFVINAILNSIHSLLIISVSAYLVGCSTLPRTGFSSNRPILVSALVTMFVLAVSPELLRPMDLYTTPDITDFRIVDRAWMQLKAEGDADPTSKEIADRIVLSSWDGRRRTGELSTLQEVQRVEQLRPYLEGENYAALLLRPHYGAIARLALVGLGALVVFFVINYFRDRPKPSYFEKIHLVFFSYCIFEYLHAVILMEAPTDTVIRKFDQIGKYVTTLILFVMTGLFLARLRFLGRTIGEFYEWRLGHKPESISRWRDGFDDMLLKTFLTKRQLKNRFMVRKRKNNGYPDSQ